MRSAVVIACCVLAGCSREERPADNEVDVNAAASQAQGAIANYAASRHERRHTRPVSDGAQVQ